MSPGPRYRLVSSSHSALLTERLMVAPTPSSGRLARRRSGSSDTQPAAAADVRGCDVVAVEPQVVRRSGVKGDDEFPLMPGERRVRFGCGALAGALGGYGLAVRLCTGKGGMILLILVVAVGF